MENGFVRTEYDNNIATIIFYHPKSNSLPSPILRKLADEITKAGNNDDVRAIVIKSEGEKAFCAGASFDELISINDYNTGKEFFMGFARVINAIRKVPKFVIGRVQGRAVGGGVGLIAACDYVLATEDASIKLSEYALGLGPFVVGLAVERKIGKAAYINLTIDCEWYDAHWAKNNNLYAETFINIEDLDYAVDSIASRIASNSLEAAAELKKAFWQGCDDWDEILEIRAEISGKLVLSDFTKEYIEQFKKK